MIEVSADEFKAFAAKTKTLDRTLRNRTKKRIRDVAQPFGRKVVAEGSQGMPSGGGLADHIATSGRTPTVSQTSTGVRLVLGKKKGPQIGKFDEGKLRHPSFGVYHRTRSGIVARSEPALRWTWKWVEQPVPAGTFTAAAESHLPEVRDAVATELDQILKELG